MEIEMIIFDSILTPFMTIVILEAYGEIAEK
jgi:hypothetical protein